MTHSVINVFSKRASRVFSIFIIFFSFSCEHYTKKNLYQKNDQNSFLNKPIKDLTLFPINAPRFRISDLKNQKAIIFFMRDRNCPLSEKHGYFISQLEKKYLKKRIMFIYNYVGRINSRENAEKDLRKFDFKGPYLIDKKQAVSNALLAQTTGEVFILTPERRIIYRGSLNVPKSKMLLKYHLVSNFLEALLSGKKVTKKEALPAPGNKITQLVIKNKVFWHDIAPIIQKKCTICHNPAGNGPIDYLTYEDVAGRKAMFKYVIENDLMPPWFIDPNTGPWENDLSLTVKEKVMLLKWVSDGTPKQKKGSLLLWKNEKINRAPPDYIIQLPQKVRIPAEGFNRNKVKTFFIQTPFKKDKWIKRVEFRLKPKVIHHALIYIMDPSFISLGSSRKNRTIALFGQIKNGSRYQSHISEDAGYMLPSGAKFILEIHYESLGYETVDDFTQIHISFHTNKPKYKLVTYTLDNKKITIPPHASNWLIKTSYKLKRTMLLARVSSHMHLRGKASSIFIVNPKGFRKRIFGIDPFSIIFHRAYTFKTPVLVYKNSSLECLNWFDNSEGNPVNPNPNKYINYGLFEKDEMSQCHFTWKVPVDSNIKNLWISSS